MKIAVLTSGGVDSSVALRLLKDAGHDLTAFYLKIWLEDELAYFGECPWEEDLHYVRQICEETNVPLKIINMQKEYCDRVIKYTIDESKMGRTPNPDIFCNRLIKFGDFYSKIDDSFEKVATGHYAQISQDSGFSSSLSLRAEGRIQDSASYFLIKAPDMVKDQTYFLAHLSQRQLSRALFPIGQYTKNTVRQLAKKYKLPNQDRKDSQGICFLGKVPFREFLKHHLGEKPGDFIEQSTGKKAGEHLGYWFYTIGQRQGLGLSGGPWFVVGKDVEKNIVYLAQGYEPELVYKNSFLVSDLHWISPEFSIFNSQFSKKNQNSKLHRICGAGKTQNSKLTVKIRHGAASHPCTIKSLNKKCVQVNLKEPVHGVAAGQFAVFYDGEVCLGCGMIL